MSKEIRFFEMLITKYNFCKNAGKTEFIKVITASLIRRTFKLGHCDRQTLEMPPNNKPIWTMNTRKKVFETFQSYQCKCAMSPLTLTRHYWGCLSSIIWPTQGQNIHSVVFRIVSIIVFINFFLQHNSFMTDGPHFFLQTYRDGDRWVFNDSVLLWTNGKRENAHPDRAPLPCKFSSKTVIHAHFAFNQNYQLDDRCGNGGRYSLHEHWACCCPMMILRR